VTQKRTKRGSTRYNSSLCAYCFSTLNTNQNGELSCSGDRLVEWQAEFDKFSTLSDEQQKEYLSKLDDPSRFINLKDCGFDTKLSPVLPNNSIRMPDPIAVVRLERSLRRKLTEEELCEGHVFYEFDIKNYQLPFINFPEDL